MPSISTIAPGSAPAGGAAFTLTINGANFIAGSQVRWNGASRTTSFVSASQLTAQITAADLAAAGPAGITVINPGPGGGLSNAAEFMVAAPGENPVPTISGISPSKQMTDVASASQITVEISGANFLPDFARAVDVWHPHNHLCEPGQAAHAGKRGRPGTGRPGQRHRGQPRPRRRPVEHRHLHDHHD